MNLVDSSAWIEFFVDGPNASLFQSAITDIERLIIPTVCIYEVYKNILQKQGEAKALQALASMKQGKIIALTETIAISASKLSIDHKLAMADSIILATAKSYHATLWTQDEDFKAIKNVKFFAKKHH